MKIIVLKATDRITYVGELITSCDKEVKLRLIRQNPDDCNSAVLNYDKPKFQYRGEIIFLWNNVIWYYIEETNI